MQAGTATPTRTEVPVDGPAGSLLGFYNELLNFPGARAAVVLLFLAFGAVVSRYAIRLLGRPIARRFVRQSVAQTVLRGVHVGIILLFGFVGLGAAGIELGNIVLSVGVFSAVVGIILAPIVGSIINGLFVLADQPFEIGDMIELAEGTTGFVDDITLRYTKVFTMDNTFAVIPNSVIRDDLVKNYSAEDERTRLQVDVAVTYESDVETARRLIERAAADCEDVIEGGPDIRIGTARYPAKPTCYIDQFGDHGIHLRLRYWARRPYKLLTVRSKVQTEVWRLLNEEGVDVTIPYPHQHLVFDETSGVADVRVDASQEPSDRSGPADRN
ncbi:mechanosensitive ion channel family protein [Halorarum salinum]|uniref:Mechanosensitive ion channel family protein n=1 Tax=Halorarum salinum TaxID=2743089 RepID=A0A7D5QHH1_9EURY|nr:mechanosensitive ion channel family protein [Halobaculum salinum]QLG62762.1 mechanosensitive ion channel family protein [Halobaculum salinum]